LILLSVIGLCRRRVAVNMEATEFTWRLKYIKLFWVYVRRIVNSTLWWKETGKLNGHKDDQKIIIFHFCKNRTGG